MSRKEKKANKSKKGQQNTNFNDFSAAAIKKAVNAEISQHPLTIYSGMASLSSVLYMLLFGSSPIFLGVSLGTMFLASSSLIVNKFFREGTFQHRYVEKLRKQLRRNTELAIIGLKKDLIAFSCPEGVEQIDLLKEKYESLVSVLKKKLKPDGLAYGRFLGMAEQVYKNGLDNLEQVSACLDSISPIDPIKTKNRIEILRQKVTNSTDTENEIIALHNTLKMRDERQAEVDRLLRENVLAMARLDQTAMDISTMETSEERATTDMEDAMDELVHLANQFRNFKPE